MLGMAEIELSFFWGSRAVPLRQCSTNVLSLLDHLEQCCPKLNSWNAVRPKTHLLKRTQESLQTELLQGVNRRETNSSPILELGYSFSLISASKGCRWWNLRIHCADYSDAVSNECTIELGTYEPCDLTLLKTLDWWKLLDGVVNIWRPEHGCLKTANANAGMIVAPLSVGWLTYLSNERFPDLPQLPKETPVREVKGLGRLVGELPTAFPSHLDDEFQKLTTIHKSFAAMFGKSVKAKQK